MGPLWFPFYLSPSPMAQEERPYFHCISGVQTLPSSSNIGCTLTSFRLWASYFFQPQFPIRNVT